MGKMFLLVLIAWYRLFRFMKVLFKKNAKSYYMKDDLDLISYVLVLRIGCKMKLKKKFQRC